MTAKRNRAAPRVTVDLGKLRKTSLKRYTKHFKLECKADSKPDLLEAVSIHFATMPVTEAEVMAGFQTFARTLRRKRDRVASAAAARAAAAAESGAR